MPHEPVPISILDYMEVESQNARVSFHYHEDLLKEHLVVDGLMRKALHGLKIDNTTANVIAQLFHFVHVQYLGALTSLMRLHLSDALAATRRGVDASLTAYELLLFPDKLQRYLERDWYFQTIKTRIEKARKADPTKYPLAAGLLILHDMGSRYGAHADISSFVLRMKRRPSEDGVGIIQSFMYFQQPETELDAESHYVAVFHNFMSMTLVFDEFTKNYAPIDFGAWKAERDFKLAQYTDLGRRLSDAIVARDKAGQAE